jgi:hypothetical protein
MPDTKSQERLDLVRDEESEYGNTSQKAFSETSDSIQEASTPHLYTYIFEGCLHEYPPCIDVLLFL